MKILVEARYCVVIIYKMEDDIFGQTQTNINRIVGFMASV